MNWVLVVLLCAWVAWRWAGVLTVRMRASMRVLAALLLFETLAGLGVAWLGLFGVLSRGSQLGLLVAMVVVTWLATARVGGSRVRLKHGMNNGEQVRAALLRRRMGLRPAEIACAFALTISVAGGAIVSLNQIRYVSTDADSMFYHLPMVAEWVQSGSIWPAEAIKLVARAYPGFKESALTALSLPLQNEHLALWAPVEYALLALLVYGLARYFGARRPLSLAAMAYVLTVPVVANSFVDQGDTDVPIAIGTCASVLFLSVLARKPGWRPAVLAGIALGATAAVKFSGLIYMVLVVVVGVFHGLVILHAVRARARRSGTAQLLDCDGVSARRCRGASGSARYGIGALLLVSLLLVAGPWYVRNLIAYGNPLYPAEIRVGGMQVFTGPMSQAELGVSTLGWNVRPLVRYWRHFTEAFGWLVPLVGSSTVWLLVLIGARPRQMVRVLPLLLLPPLFAVAFLHHPYNQPSAFGADYNMRYLISCFVLCTCGLTAAVAQSKRFAGLLTILLLLGAVCNLRAWTNWWWLLAGLAAVAGVVVVLQPQVMNSIRSAWRVLGDRRLQSAVCWLLPGLLLLSAGWMVDRVRTRLQYAAGYGYGRIVSQPGWGTIVSHVHRDISGQGIAVVGDILLFPLYGDGFSNRLYSLGWSATTDEIMACCEANGVGYVVAFAPRGVRNAAGEFEVGESVAHELLRRYPDRFMTVMEDSGSFLLSYVGQPMPEERQR